MISRTFNGLFWAYVCLEVSAILGALWIFLLGTAEYLFLLVYSEFFIYVFITYCIYRIRDINPNFKRAFWFTSVNCILNILGLFMDESVNSSAWITNTFGVFESILNCLIIWFICGGIYSLAKQSNLTSLKAKANFRKYLYVIPEIIFMIWWPYFDYIMSNDPAEIPNQSSWIIAIVAIYPVMILYIVSVILLILLFRQTAKELT